METTFSTDDAATLISYYRATAKTPPSPEAGFAFRVAAEMEDGFPMGETTLASIMNGVALSTLLTQTANEHMAQAQDAWGDDPEVGANFVGRATDARVAANWFKSQGM